MTEEEVITAGISGGPILTIFKSPSYECPKHGNIGTNSIMFYLDWQSKEENDKKYCSRCYYEFTIKHLHEVKKIED